MDIREPLVLNFLKFRRQENGPVLKLPYLEYDHVNLILVIELFLLYDIHDIQDQHR
jgi:hypothetical protein